MKSYYIEIGADVGANGVSEALCLMDSETHEQVGTIEPGRGINVGSKGCSSMTDPLKPNASLLCKLGSIAVHADESMSDEGHAFDKTALEGLIADPEVVEWLAEMDKLALIPKKR